MFVVDFHFILMHIIYFKFCNALVSLNRIFYIFEGVDGQIKAYFNMNGVIGDVEFVSSGSTTTKAIVTLSVAGPWTSWEIREFPVTTTDDTNVCGNQFLGNRYARF